MADEYALKFRSDEINAKNVKGEPGTGYEDRVVKGVDKGDFHCDNCEYFRKEESSCGQEDMVKKSKKRMLASGRREVDPKGCCEYIGRVGKKK